MLARGGDVLPFLENQAQNILGARDLVGLVQLQKLFDAGLRLIHVPQMVAGNGFVEIGFEVPMPGVGGDQGAGRAHGFGPILAIQVSPHQRKLRRKRLRVESHGVPERLAGFGRLRLVVVHQP